MGVASCGRHGAVFGMNLDYEISEYEGQKCYVFRIFESKTEHINKGMNDKYVIDEDLQKSVDDLKAKGINRLNEEDLNRSQLDKKIRTALLDLYEFLGKSTIHEGYFVKHWFHVLRHVGAHYWLRKTEYNHSVVALVGGWKIVQELIDSYGATPHEIVMKKIFGK